MDDWIPVPNASPKFVAMFVKGVWSIVLPHAGWPMQFAPLGTTTEVPMLREHIERVMAIIGRIMAVIGRIGLRIWLVGP